ncbi:MAG: tRNA guanosine(34) transglycosylase Tgt [Treponema sp.]|jgi:queuine tRNA-ribosyltransferase|nr:tRNA guanosine(34) transglycosylase Tgt [Treponema sp.]
MNIFSEKHRDSSSRARTGTLFLPHGTVSTPVFMPVGTCGTVKALTRGDLEEIGFNIILSNTYHLYLRPGTDVIGAAGGLHRFMGWPGNILTDSGGFQIFSLARLRKIREEGVRFQSHIDGSWHFIDPEKAVDIQTILGSDIQMQLDVCSGWGASRKETEEALAASSAWLLRAKKTWEEKRREGLGGSLFAIVQGGFFRDLRERSAVIASQADTPGIAIGGLSVGEPEEIFAEYLSYAASLLPGGKPRYVMGIGTPRYILEAVEQGIDMFDCVLPTRTGRNGLVFSRDGSFALKKAEFRLDFRPIDEECGCKVCREYSRAYLRHLFKSGEILCSMLASYHNLYFLHDLVRNAGKAIEENRFTSFKKDFLSRFEKREK